jgi:hypothetical protein
VAAEGPRRPAVALQRHRTVSLRPERPPLIRRMPRTRRLRGREGWGRLALPASRTLLLLIVALGLADCGKKGSPQPPPGVPNVYPRSYPRE